MKNIKHYGKRWLAMVLSLVMCFGLLQTTSLAANWNPGDKITINVRVYDESTGAVYNVGTDSVEKGNPELIQSVTYQIPQLTKFVNANQFGRVTKVVGNWYFPAGDRSPGSNVEWSCNANSVTMTYWVDWYKTGSGSGSGSDQDTTVNIGSGGRYNWTQYIVYHSNYPDGNSYSYKVTYNIQSYTATYNDWGCIKSLSDVKFSTPNGYEAKSPIWNTNQEGTGTGYAPGSQFTFQQANNGKTLHLYAQWQPTGGTVVTPVTLTYMDGTTVYGTRNYFAGDTATAILCTTEKAGYTFAGWDTDSSAQTVKYKAGIEFTINSNMTLYAVWEKNSSGPEATDCITVNKVFSGLTIDEFPWDFSIEYTAVNTKEPEYSTTKTLTMDNADDFDETTMTVTWLAPHYSKTGGSTVTIKENCDVDGYTYTTTTTKGTVDDSTHTVSMSFVNASTKGTVTLTNTYVPGAVTPDKELTGITKTRITSANQDSLPDGFNLSGINISEMPQIPADLSPIKLLYKISVTGTPETEFTVTDVGAELVPGYDWDGVIGENGVADIYVTKDVTLDMIAGGDLVENTASVVPAGDAGPVAGLTSNRVSTKVYGRNVSGKTGTPIDEDRISEYTIQITNKMGCPLASLTVEDTLDSRAKFIDETAQATLVLKDGTERALTEYTYSSDVNTNVATWTITETIPLEATVRLTYSIRANDVDFEGNKLLNTYTFWSDLLMTQSEAQYDASVFSLDDVVLDLTGSGFCAIEVPSTNYVDESVLSEEGES